LRHSGTPRGVAVILLSFNRPAMLDLAYASAADADEIILVDDGSDAFDPTAWADARAIRWRVFGTRRSVDRRMTTPSLGRLINGALHIAYHRADAAAVAYLCDDDLFGPAWLDAVREALADPAGPHVCRGRWRSFDDPLADGPLPKPGLSRPARLDLRQMTTGNFAHRVECYAEGLRWSEETVAVHDDTFLWRLHGLHPYTGVFDTGVLAGYRREHEFNMANFTSHSEYGIGAYEALSRGTLE
jgi:glycosyltransferase involved in cell wall biosynthesis